jgi:hypothetical protein
VGSTSTTGLSRDDAVRRPDQLTLERLISGGEIRGRPVAPEHRDEDGHVDGQGADRAEWR